MGLSLLSFLGGDGGSERAVKWRLGMLARELPKAGSSLCAFETVSTGLAGLETLEPMSVQRKV